MQYQVPQFIEVEDKIFGPLTLRQFIYLAGGGGLCLLFFSLLPFWLMLILALPVMGFSAALAFYQINGRPFIIALEHAFSYFFGSKLYLWKQRQEKNTADRAAVALAKASGVILPGLVPKLSESKLKDLSWSLNIKDRGRVGGGDTPHRTGFEI
ncbi:PrgI family protein [Acetobacteraceae bacterium]|nr:PrgI family protein [Candidatus Parcubacteria bacterium]